MHIFFLNFELNKTLNIFLPINSFESKRLKNNSPIKFVQKKTINKNILCLKQQKTQQNII